MNRENNPSLTAIARTLRKNMTKEERRLWYTYLRKLPVTINRQKVFGKYILDFYCASAKTAIELDGSQHYTEGGKHRDSERDKYLSERGIVVLRYTNLDVNLHFGDVCEAIGAHLIRHPSGDTFSSRRRQEQRK